MKFNLNKPCADCPFRTDIKPYLRAGRAQEITNAVLRENKTFQCHKTLDKKMGSHCAGALVLVEKTKKPNAMIQIAERLGIYDPSKLDLDAPVYESQNAMVETHRLENN